MQLTDWLTNRQTNICTSVKKQTAWLYVVKIGNLKLYRQLALQYPNSHCPDKLTDGLTRSRTLHNRHEDLCTTINDSLHRALPVGQSGRMHVQGCVTIDLWTGFWWFLRCNPFKDELNGSENENQFLTKICKLFTFFTIFAKNLVLPGWTQAMQATINKHQPCTTTITNSKRKNHAHTFVPRSDSCDRQWCRDSPCWPVVVAT